MQGKAGRLTGKFHMGDRVSLKSHAGDAPEWRVVAFSYGRGTFDLMACNPRAPEQFRNGMAPEQLELIEPAPEPDS